MEPLQTFSIRIFCERIKKDLNNGLADTDFTISDNEIIFHIDQARAATLVGNVYGLAKVEGVLTTPEAYLTTYLVSDLRKNDATGEWYADLPQPPVSLPLGYSITDVYISQSYDGDKSIVFPIESKRVGYRKFMPAMPGIRYHIKGLTIFLQTSNGGSLLRKNLYVTMAKARTIDRDEELNWPDDQTDAIYNMVMDKLKKRITNPQDVIQDGLPAGNKTS
jgi:hypothetical protein